MSRKPNKSDFLEASFNFPYLRDIEWVYEGSMARGYNSDFNNHWKTDMIGVHLNFTNNQTGKKVFDWTFWVAGKKDRISVEVKAYNNGTDMWFQASGDHIPEAVKNTDINALRAQVQDILTEQVTLLTNVEWEDWFEVIVDGDNSDFNDSRFSALGANLKVRINRLKRGIDPKTGRVLTVNNGSVMDFPMPSRIDDPEVTVNGLRTGSSVEKSYIPATAENRAAIDDILLRMQTLRHSIAEFLSQENITDTLGQNLMKVLPKP